MRILVPVDGSDCSLRAVSHVIAVRRHFGPADELELHLANVQVGLPGEVGQFISAEQIAGFHREESEKALAPARALLDAAGLRYQTHTEVGRVAETVAALADRLQCDQIAMGTHGRGALADLLVGSTTVRVVHLSTVPVLLVK
jgi:nucleotide-binding universal stress UspA family protein